MVENLTFWTFLVYYGRRSEGCAHSNDLYINVESMKLSRIGKWALAAGMVASVALPMVANALSLEDIGSTLGYGTADLKATVIKIINLVLGLLALIAVIMVIYGGFIWLTAAGNEENVEKAKRIISAAVIGIVIILLAWAVVIFVARTTANVTT